MPGFEYTAISSTGADRIRNYLSLAGETRQTKAGSFTTPASSGNFSVTGVGFQPDALCIFGIESAAAFNQKADGEQFHFGFATSPAAQWGASIYGIYLGSHGHSHPYKYSALNTAIITICRVLTGDDPHPQPVATEVGSLVSFNADGFTINWDNTSQYTIVYFAMKGGNYACGTATSGSGSQAITGLGFSPTAAMFGSVQRTTLTSAEGDHRLTIGTGDDLTDVNSWGGTESSDVYHDIVASDTAVMSMLRETNAAGPFDPLLYTEASLQSLDADGFTLNWFASDGTGRRFGWFATDGQTDAGTWVYNHPTDTNFKRTDLKYIPKGIIFFGNDMGSTTRDYPSTAGYAMGFGVCDQDLTGQYEAGWMVISPPAIGNNQISSRYLFSNQCIGSHRRRSSAFTAPDTGRDEGRIVKFLPKRQQQIIRYR